MPPEYNEIGFWLLLLAGFSAGFIDSIVGGGGLIQLPAFFLAFPGWSPAMVLGSNKLAAFSGTSLAAVKYVRNTTVPWRAIVPAIITALIFSVLGAQLVTFFDKELFKPIVLILLVAVAIYTAVKKDFGLLHQQGLSRSRSILYSLLTGAALGLYDGFFGPGTGSFLIVIYISVFGFDFLHASVSAKLINCATNFAALAWFAYTGNIRYDIAIPLAICNMAGNYLGVKLALKQGSAFIRVFYLVIITGMIFKFGYDLWTE